MIDRPNNGADEVHDVAIIGGGPAGSTAAITLADAGKSVLIIEREAFPRFRIGESFLPKTLELIQEMGLEERLRACPHWVKLGIEIGFGDGRADLTRISFGDVMVESEHQAFNMRRSIFDKLLLDAAIERGARTTVDNGVRSVDKVTSGDVRLTLDDGTDVRARQVIDASGQASVLGRSMGTRKIMDEFRNIAYYEHFENVVRPSGDRVGFASVIMCREGWFWMIPLDEKTTSVGVVVDSDIARKIDVPANQRLQWCIRNCPVIAERMANAVGPEKNQVISDFSYTCAPYAGDGYFLVGDAAAFVDPVWSTGATLGMLGGRHAGQLLNQVLDGRMSATRAARRHHKWLTRHRRTFLKLIGSFYDHSFRELVIEGKGPMETHRALITLLAGGVFPNIPFRVRWRWEMLQVMTAFHRRIPIVGKRRPHSMLSMAGIRFDSPLEGVVASSSGGMKNAWRGH
jgi:flavin-dependent dehydrogenase